MKFTVNRKQLHDALSDVVQASGEKVSALLGNILIRASGQEITLIATDMDITLAAFVPASIKEEGVVLARGRLLTDIVGGSTGEQVDVSLSSNVQRMKVTCGGTKGYVPLAEVKLYPTIPDLEEEGLDAIEVDGKKLRDAIRFSLPISEHRTAAFTHDATLLEIVGGALRIVAIDGHRLGVAREAAIVSSGDSAEARRWIVPARALKFVYSLTDDTVIISSVMPEGHKIPSLCVKSVTGRSMMARLPEVKWPDHDAILDKNATDRASDVALVVSPEDLGLFASRLSIVASRQRPNVLLRVNKDKLVLDGALENPELGSMDDRIGIDSAEVKHDVEPVISVNINYLQEAASQMGKFDKVVVSWADGRMMTIVPKDTDGSRSVLIVGSHQ